MEGDEKTQPNVEASVKTQNHQTPITQQEQSEALPIVPNNGNTIGNYCSISTNQDYVDVDSFGLPPGYRFCPYDDELIVHYLARKVMNKSLPHNKIKEINLSDHNPRGLAEKYELLGEKEWYFFTPRDRKYPNGSRPDRKAGDGYWKATGADKLVKCKGVTVGYRKALVFYEGRPPKGNKTNWIMHEYRVDEPPRKRSGGNSMRLDDWVLCRIYKKADTSSKNRKRDREGELVGYSKELVDMNGFINMYDNDYNDMNGFINMYDNDEQSPLQNVLTEIPHFMDASLSNLVEFNGQLQPSYNYGPKPTYFGPPVYPTENTSMPKYLEEDAWDSKVKGFQDDVWSIPNIDNGGISSQFGFSNMTCSDPPMNLDYVVHNMAPNNPPNNPPSDP